MIWYFGGRMSQITNDKAIDLAQRLKLMLWNNAKGKSAYGQMQIMAESIEKYLRDSQPVTHANPEIAKIPEGWKLVPVEPTGEMIKAMAESKAVDDEGQFPALCELIDFSGENKTRTVLKAAYADMLAASTDSPL
jgi:hypothetical protein